METLTGKTAVVTGGASGIGFALAEALGKQGANVAIADIEEAVLDEALVRLEEMGIDALGVLTDVTDPNAVDRLADEVTDAYGAVHLVCNNAGVGPGGVTWEVPREVWRWVLDVDLWGVVNGIRTFVPRLVAQGEGHVVNTASAAGLVASPGMAPYSAAKHAVVGLSVSLRRDLELAGSPVGVTVVCPSFTRTRMNESGRNWPEQLGPPPEAGLAPGHPQTRATYFEKMQSAAMDPRVVAERTVEAVLAQRFWVVLDSSLSERFTPHVDEILEAARMTGGSG